MSNFEQLAREIGAKFNNPKQWKIDTILPLFQQYPDKTPADLLSFFETKSAVGFVYGAYIHHKSGVAVARINTALVGKYANEISVFEDETAMLAELIRISDWDKANKTAPERLDVIKKLSSDLDKFEGSIGYNSEEELQALSALVSKFNRLVPSPALV